MIPRELLLLPRDDVPGQVNQQTGSRRPRAPLPLPRAGLSMIGVLDSYWAPPAGKRGLLLSTAPGTEEEEEEEGGRGKELVVRGF